MGLLTAMTGLLLPAAKKVASGLAGWAADELTSAQKRAINEHRRRAINGMEVKPNHPLR